MLMCTLRLFKLETEEQTILKTVNFTWVTLIRL